MQRLFPRTPTFQRFFSSSVPTESLSNRTSVIKQAIEIIDQHLAIQRKKHVFSVSFVDKIAKGLPPDKFKVVKEATDIASIPLGYSHPEYLIDLMEKLSAALQNNQPLKNPGIS